jgi:UDP-N-acetylmuramate--alanine ligase
MTRRVHLVGIGGAGLSAIARILLERGEQVSGSDQADSPFAAALASAGVPISIGHRPEAVPGADLVIASSAVPASDPELVAAEAAGIPVLRRPQFLGELVQGYQTIAVAGTHGKTTTTAMLAWILSEAGLQPSFIAGGVPIDFGVNARHGTGKHFVIEADEYRRTFLALQPFLAVVTNVEHDHPDYFPSPADFRQAFEQFVRQIQETLVVCTDDPVAAELSAPGLRRVTYGTGPEAEWRAEEIRDNSAGGSDFLVLRGEEMMGLVRLRLPGLHNVRNALGALAAAEPLGVGFGAGRSALAKFRGVGRRFEVIGSAQDVTVIDDYAHHPSEIRATLQAARQRYPQADLWAVFQPHTFSRTRAFAADLAQAFVAADHVIVVDIYASREALDPQVSAARLAAEIEGKDVRYVPELEQAAARLIGEVKPGSVVLTLSAGDGNRVGRLVLDGLQTLAKGERHA